MTFPNDVTKTDGGAITRPLPLNVAPSVPVQTVPNYTGMQAQAYSAPAGAMTAGGKVYDTTAPRPTPPFAPAAGNAYPPYKSCIHSGPNWTHGETVIVADKIVNLDRRSDLALIVDCSDADPRPEVEPQLILPAGYESLAEFYAPTPRIQIPWPDYGTPRLPAKFWQELARLLPAGKVAFGCVGGHGRTGSALVAIRMTIWGESFLDALALVRKAYCAEAVETMGQRIYLRDLGIALGTTRAGTSAGTETAAASMQREYKTVVLMDSSPYW